MNWQLSSQQNTAEKIGYPCKYWNGLWVKTSYFSVFLLMQISLTA